MIRKVVAISLVPLVSLFEGLAVYMARAFLIDFIYAREKRQLN